jgi:hypothetical protein
MGGTSFTGARGRLARGTALIPEPAGPDVRLPVPAGIRLDVEDGRAVDEVEAGDLEDAAVPAEEPEDAQPERIRSMGRARGEDAPGFRLARRSDLELGRPGLMKLEKDDDMGEALQAVQAGGELRPDLDLAGRTLEEPRRGESRGREVGRLLVALTDGADGLEAGRGAHLPT